MVNSKFAAQLKFTCYWRVVKWSNFHITPITKKKEVGDLTAIPLMGGRRIDKVETRKKGSGGLCYDCVMWKKVLGGRREWLRKGKLTIYKN